MGVQICEQRARTAALAGHDGFALISNEKLWQLYATMVKCRLLAEQVRSLIAFAGQEAALVGVALDLLSEDTIAPSSCAPARFIQGAQLEEILRDCAASPEPVERLESALGAALVNKTKQNGKIVVVFGREEQYEAGDWQETLHVAGVHQLPMIFLRWSAAKQPASRQPKTDSHGFPVIPVDGNDVVAVYRVATESIAHARRGNGATLIDCQSGIFLESSPRQDDDPIRNMESYLRQKQLFGEESRSALLARFAKDVDLAIEAAAR
jgi:TPP-dependent pyruvate/acetoin dehydrogenase alpha subunit